LTLQQCDVQEAVDDGDVEPVIDVPFPEFGGFLLGSRDHNSNHVGEAFNATGTGTGTAKEVRIMLHTDYVNLAE
jgi:hypothetical protein